MTYMNRNDSIVFTSSSNNIRHFLFKIGCKIQLKNYSISQIMLKSQYKSWYFPNIIVTGKYQRSFIIRYRQFFILGLYSMS